MANFTKWMRERGINYWKLPHGVIWRLKQDYNDFLVSTGRQFDDLITGTVYVAGNRNAKKHKMYYNLKLQAVQRDTFEAWEIFRNYCKRHDYFVEPRNAV